MPRPHRFYESSEAPQATDLATRTFYADGQLEERMARVRRTIVQVRQSWDTGRRHMADQLLHWLEEQQAAAAAAAADADELTNAWSLVLTRWRAILAVDRNWADLRDRPEYGQLGDIQDAEDFSVLREYTDEKSYQMVFGPVLRAMRSSDDSRVTLMVYLIELMNIDLFNYSRVQPYSPERAYRGLLLSQSEWLSYQRLLERPVASRFIAVPLALTSSSRSPEVALQFAAKQQQQQQQKQQADASSSVLCLLAIHVIGVPDSLMELYRRRFPQSVVSTICAVDISGVSVHPDEQEILLRGAFFQLLSLDEPREFSIPAAAAGADSVDLNGQRESTVVRASVQEALVITANRDHLSNGRLGDQDAPARALFAAIVRVTRYRYCLGYCREREMLDDATEYEAALRESEQELQKLLDN